MVDYAATLETARVVGARVGEAAHDSGPGLATPCGRIPVVLEVLEAHHSVDAFPLWQPGPMLPTLRDLQGFHETRRELRVTLVTLR